MLSHTHDSLVRLLLGTPRLLPQLLRDRLGVAVPTDFDLLPGPDTARPAPAKDYPADGTIVLRDRETGARAAFIVEVQLSRASAKRYTWPLYVASMRIRLKCPVTLVVVTPDPAVARWASKPIELGRDGRSVLCPLVLGPSQIPEAPDPRVLAESPALGVLAVIMHGHKPDAATLGRHALEAAGRLAADDEIRGKLYGDLIVSFLSDQALIALRDEMEPDSTGYISEFARSYVRQGRDEGRREGRQEERVNSLRLVLRARALVLTPAQEQRLAGCTDMEQLDRWIERAMTATDVDSIFA